MKVSDQYSERFAKSPDGLPDDERLWWCRSCGAVFDRHHSETKERFCANCEMRDAVLVGLKPVGPGSDGFWERDRDE